MSKLGDRVFRDSDLSATGVVSDDQLAEAIRVADRFGQKTVLSGESTTSEGLVNDRPTEVFVVTGDIVKQELSWLDRLYRGELVSLASEFAGAQMFPAKDLVSGVNVNVLRGPGASYEWHVDSNPVTGLLFLNTLSADEGGQLVFRTTTEDLSVHPRAGTFLAFDAREIEHCVLPLAGDIVRYSVPMNFYLDADEQQRPEDLDYYLFGDIGEKR